MSPAHGGLQRTQRLTSALEKRGQAQWAGLKRSVGGGFPLRMSWAGSKWKFRFNHYGSGYASYIEGFAQ